MPVNEQVLIGLPCTLRQLETAVHQYGDHHGFDGDIVIGDVRGLDGSMQTVILIREKDEEHGEEPVHGKEG